MKGEPIDQETASYIWNYFPRFFTHQERMAFKHYSTCLKNEDDIDSVREKMYRKMGWMADDPQVLDLLKDGYEQFEINVATRILSENPDDIFMNTCPECDKLARTPAAKQCRHCGFNWHDLTKGQFRLKKSFEIAGRNFFLAGELTKGEIYTGNFADLTMVGLNCRPKIIAVEYVLQREKDIEDICLEVKGLNEKQMEYLMKLGAYAVPIDILEY